MFRHQKTIDQRIHRVIVGNNSTVIVGTQDFSRGPEQQNVQQALSFPEMYNRLHEIPDATSGTCQWILENHTFRDWQNAQRGLLWIKGKPGTGKSTIMKYMWDHFASETSSETLTTASFFCHGRGVDLQKSTIGVWRALLHQIVEKVPQVNKDLEYKFRARCRTQGLHGSAWDWTESELRKFTKDYLLNSCRDLKLLIFVEALDECGEDNGWELLDFLQNVVTASEALYNRLKICVSSRHYPLDRSDVLYEIIVDNENSADIRTFVDQKLNRFRNRTRRYDELLSSIASRAGEIFQWCALVVSSVVRSLESKRPMELILQEIRETPRELFDLYRQIVRSYMTSTSINYWGKKQFSDLLCWVALAKRPLSISELRFALSIDKPNQYFRHWHSYIPHGSNIQHLSCGLAKVVELPDSSDHRDRRFMVDFIHHSVQDYFVSGGGIQDLLDSGSATIAMRMAELDIVKICYESVVLYQPQAYADTQRPMQRPLLAYACNHIFDHAHSAEEGQPLTNDLVKILNFPKDDFLSIMDQSLDSKERIRTKSDLVSRLFKFRLPWRSSQHNPRDNLLHVAARYDIPNLISSVLDLVPDMSINIRNPRRYTALHCAAQDGSLNAINRLLDISQTFRSESMLYRWQRRLRVLQLNARDKKGFTPLMWATARGHSKIVERLAQMRGVDLNTKDRDDGFTALRWAIEYGHSDAASVLIRHGAARDKGSPLLLASHSGQRPPRSV